MTQGDKQPVKVTNATITNKNIRDNRSTNIITTGGQPAQSPKGFLSTLVVLLIAASVLLGLLRPAQLVEWKIKFYGLEASGANLALGFAVLLLAVLWALQKKQG